MTGCQQSFGKPAGGEGMGREIWLLKLIQILRAANRTVNATPLADTLEMSVRPICCMGAMGAHVISGFSVSRPTADRTQNQNCAKTGITYWYHLGISTDGYASERLDIHAAAYG